MKQPTLPDFTGKTLQLSVEGSDYTYAIDRARFEKQGARLFLVGTVPPGGSTADWSEGVITAVAWDQVTDYLVFDSAEDFATRIAKYRKYKRKA